MLPFQQVGQNTSKYFLWSMIIKANNWWLCGRIYIRWMERQTSRCYAANFFHNTDLNCVLLMLPLCSLGRKDVGKAADEKEDTMWATINDKKTIARNVIVFSSISDNKPSVNLRVDQYLIWSKWNIFSIFSNALNDEKTIGELLRASLVHLISTIIVELSTNLLRYSVPINLMIAVWHLISSFSRSGTQKWMNWRNTLTWIRW